MAPRLSKKRKTPKVPQTRYLRYFSLVSTIKTIYFGIVKPILRSNYFGVFQELYRQSKSALDGGHFNVYRLFCVRSVEINKLCKFVVLFNRIIGSD